jgi:hypothetical protein
MTIRSRGKVATVQALKRDDLLCAARKRYSALLLSDKELGDVLDMWLGCGAFDITRNENGEIEFRLRD